MDADPADIVMIEQLLHKYGHLVDAKAYDRFDEIFTADCVVDHTPVHAPKVCHGLADVREYFDGANHPAAHHVSNIWVEIEDGRHRVRSKFFAPFTRESHSPKRWYGGDYDDIVVRTPAGWRIAHRVCTPRWQFTPDTDPAVPEGRRTF
jgi:3-phenylpropionate/cinnamic acid dioxygenase small subunit